MNENESINNKNKLLAPRLKGEKVKKMNTDQVLTYMGNKRNLIDFVLSPIPDILKDLGKEKLVTADLFSGSGIVAQNLKEYSSILIANDLEGYSKIINESYLTNKCDFDEDEYNGYLNELLALVEEHPIEGVITKYYAPKDTNNIQSGERCFFTHENAVFIDSVRYYIDVCIPEHLKIFFLARLLIGASIHANTAGHMKSFYKSNITGIGKFGGDGENALARILGTIDMSAPQLMDSSCENIVFQEDANELVRKLKGLDVAYIDPPYNQHPYGSNYHILNTIVKNEIPENISRVSGIPKDWNRSDYNKKNKAKPAFEDLIANTDAKYIIVSYSNEGFISTEEMKNILSKYGQLEIKSKEYNTYRGSRNLNNRDIYVEERLFILKKH